MSAMTADPKATLRSDLRAGRRELAAGRDREADARRLAGHVLALVSERVGPGRVCRVAAYAALPAEPPTDRLVEALEAAGHEVILPVMLADKALDWTLHTPGAPASAAAGRSGHGTVDGLRLGQDGIATADVVVTPGLAVDREGTRLGQGGGSYDRALARRRVGALVVTLLHDGELSDTPLPRQPHDLPVDGVVTADGGWVRCRPSA